MNTKRYILLCLFVVLAFLMQDRSVTAAEPVAVTSEYAHRHYTTQDATMNMV